ncbi:MAG: DUF5689 domain-containing protein [Bacteroidales bacterium]
MKQVRNIFSAILATVLGVTSCTPDFDAPKPNDSVLPTANYTISQIKDIFIGNESGLISNNPDIDNGRYKDLYTVYNFVTPEQVTINGVVISTDEGGNTYKKLVIRDVKDSSCIDISIDVSGISAVYPYGQPVQVTCNKIQIGLYAGLPTLGREYINEGKSARVEVGRMSWPLAKTIIKAYGMPDKSWARPFLRTITDIKNAGKKDFSQLVTVKKVRFGYYVKNDGSESEFSSDKYVIIGSPEAKKGVTFSFETSSGAPVSRLIQDEQGNIFPLTTSQYAKFANDTLPEGLFDVTGIVGWYHDNAGRQGNYQLSVQQRKDIVKSSSDEGGDGNGDATGEGTQASPYNVAKAMIAQNENAKWVKGYIVGCVKNGTTAFDNPDQAIFDNFDSNTNVLIADSPEETDYTKCLSVKLNDPTAPAGMREAVGLMANPGNKGKVLLIEGNLKTMFSSLKGLRDITAYELQGATEPPVPPVGDNIFEESFATSQGTFTTNNVLGAQVWIHEIYGGKGYMKMSGFADGASHANEDWLISPAIDLTGVTAATISFDHTINKGDVANMKTNHTLQFSADNGTTWEQVAITTYPTGTNWTFVNSGDIAIPAKFLGKSGIKFAFKYLSSDTESASWEINNVIVKK